MAANQQARPDPPDSPAEPYARQRTQSEAPDSMQPTDILELLGDEYTQRVLTAIGDQARTCQEIMSAADVSKATAYRRLECLEDAGLVKATQRLDPDGQHCKQFHTVVEQIDVKFSSDDFEVTIETASVSSRHQTSLMLADD